MRIFAAALAVFALVFVETCVLRARVLFYPVEEYYLKEDDLSLIADETNVTCPEMCPIEKEPICSSNGFCIKLFDSPCQLVLFNCKGSEEYKQIHPRYCDMEKYGTLQPTACHNTSLSKLPD